MKLSLTEAQSTAPLVVTYCNNQQHQITIKARDVEEMLAHCASPSPVSARTHGAGGAMDLLCGLIADTVMPWLDVHIHKPALG